MSPLLAERSSGGRGKGEGNIISRMKVPPELKYTKSDEWVRVEGDTATIGITDYAQSELGDIVFVDLSNPGRSIKREESFGSIESVKTVSDLYAPISGEVVAINETLGAQAELVNADPYGSGWLAKIRLSDPSEVNELLDAGAYQAKIEA